MLVLILGYALFLIAPKICPERRFQALRSLDIVEYYPEILSNNT
jgi:hypothetical protein